MSFRSLPESKDYDLGMLKWGVGGGERTPAQLIEAFGSLFPNGRYVDAYGLTETCSGDTMMQAGREIEKIGSAGRALSHVRIQIRDGEGRLQPVGQIGEIRSEERSVGEGCGRQCRSGWSADHYKKNMDSVREKDG